MSERLDEAAWGRLGDRLARLLDSGIPLLQAILFLKERGGKKERMQADAIASVLREGRPLSQALRNGGAPLLMQTLVEVGEHQGDLAGSLFRASAHCAERVKWRRERRHAMAYPFFVCLVLVFVCLFLCEVVIPRFADLYAGMGLKVSGMTRLLFAAADAGPLVLGAGVLAAGIAWWTGRKRSFWKKLPLLSRWESLDRTHEWSSTLGLLIDGGLPLLHALDVQASLPLKQENQALCRRIREQVLRGGLLSDALQGEEAFEESLALAVQVAEVTGDLPRSLLAAEKELAEQRKRMMNGLIKWLEPALLVVAGLMVGLVALFMLWPMLDLIHSI